MKILTISRGLFRQRNEGAETFSIDYPPIREVKKKHLSLITSVTQQSMSAPTIYTRVLLKQTNRSALTFSIDYLLIRGVKKRLKVVPSITQHSMNTPVNFYKGAFETDEQKRRDVFQ